MPDEEQALYDHILRGYQNRLATAEFELLREQARSALKDQRIAELEAAQVPKPDPR